MAEAFGVRRVTATAAALQHAGVIHYKRGRVRVLNRVGLEAAACPCYEAIRAAVASAFG